MANGDPIHILSWDAQATGYLSWSTGFTEGGTVSYDTGQSVPDGSSTALKLLRNTGSSFLYVEGQLNWNTAGTYTTGCVGFWFKGSTTETGNTNAEIASVYRSANSARNWRLYLNSSGELRLGFWGTNQVSSALTTINSGWHYIQVAWDYSTTTNKLKLAVDGVTYAEQTYTAAAAPALDWATLGWNTTNSTDDTSAFYYGPWVFTSGYHIPTRLFVKLCRPTGDVDSNWTCSTGTSRYQLVDDAPDSETTYISSATSGQSQRFDMTDVTLTSNQSIAAVQAFGLSTPGTGTTPTSTFYITNSGGTDLSCITNFGAVSSYALFVSDTKLTDPSGSAWTSSVFNGCRMRLQKAANTDTCKISEMYVAVAITAPYQYTQSLTAGLSFSGAHARIKKNLKALTGALSFTGGQTRRSFRTQAFTATLTFTTNAVTYMYRILQDAGGWYIKKGRIRRRRPY